MEDIIEFLLYPSKQVYRPFSFSYYNFYYKIFINFEINIRLKL
jgi:hypothetical protein